MTTLKEANVVSDEGTIARNLLFSALRMGGRFCSCTILPTTEADPDQGQVFLLFLGGHNTS